MAKIGIIGKIVNSCPKHEFDGGRGEKVINFFDKYISVPENRLLIGVSALASQPFIDLYNKDVDEKTRVVSCARTIAKTAVGTVTGVAIRAGFISLAKNYSVVDNADAKFTGTKKIRKLFTPTITTSDKTHAYRQYQNTMGTLLAVGAMLFTNFLIDAPLTTFFTNHLMKTFGVDTQDPKQIKKEVLNEKS